MTTRKEEVITFKVDRDLGERIRNIANRSEFIRTAVLAALENSCPLCGGRGVLTPTQRDAWEDFAHHHRMEANPASGDMVLVCDAAAHGPRTAKGHRQAGGAR